MLSREIESCSNALGALLHTVGEEQAAVIRQVRNVLAAAKQDAETMEHFFMANPGEEKNG